MDLKHRNPFIGRLGRQQRPDVDARVHLAGLVDEVPVLGVGESHVQHRHVDEPGVRAVGHRVPVVPAVRGREHDGGVVDIACARFLDRAAGFGVDALCPVHRNVGLGGDERAVGPVEHVEEAVLRRLHDDLAHVAADLEVGEDHVLRRRVVPRLAGRRLVVPDQRPVVRIERDDGGEEQVVAARPGLRISRFHGEPFPTPM